ncbi:unnamed protein product [Prorocentrum cordatum]|uniref:Uncharacterized protein n=1 Tax=Prorocentrum cordatum TaxID=2364126 RepID=A0ABN9WIN6_9DINO|nr:unnamed protein product [Polarella glacialis]
MLLVKASAKLSGKLSASAALKPFASPAWSDSARPSSSCLPASRRRAGRQLSVSVPHAVGESVGEAAGEAVGEAAGEAVGEAVGERGPETLRVPGVCVCVLHV